MIVRRLGANIRPGAADRGHRGPNLLVDDAPAVAAAEAGTDQRSLSPTARDDPVNVGFAPAVAGTAVQAQRVILTMQVDKCGETRHRPNRQNRFMTAPIRPPSSNTVMAAAPIPNPVERFAGSAR